MAHVYSQILLPCPFAPGLLLSLSKNLESSLRELTFMLNASSPGASWSHQPRYNSFPLVLAHLEASCFQEEENILPWKLRVTLSPGCGTELPASQVPQGPWGAVFHLSLLPTVPLSKGLDLSPKSSPWDSLQGLSTSQPCPTPLPFLCLKTHMTKAPPTSTPCKQIYAIAPTKLTNVWTLFCYSIRHTCTHTRMLDLNPQDKNWSCLHREILPLLLIFTFFALKR